MRERERERERAFLGNPLENIPVGGKTRPDRPTMCPNNFKKRHKDIKRLVSIDGRMDEPMYGHTLS